MRNIPIRSDEAVYNTLILDAENELIQAIRSALQTQESIINITKAFKFEYNPKISQTYVSLFQEGVKSIRWGSKKESFIATIKRCVEKLKQHQAFESFEIANSNKCRILVEVIIDESACDLKTLNQNVLNNERFEMGIDGLRLHFGDKNYFYLPTDATVNSHLSLKDVLNFFAKKIDLSKYTNSISKRLEMLKILELEWYKTRSIAFISYEDSVLVLHRGIPAVGSVDFETLVHISKKSIQWALENQKSNGQFLYYYDGVNDSEVDHEHQNMRDPLYYNMLRHSGGIIALLHMYGLEKNPEYIRASEKAIEYLSTQSEFEEIHGHSHAYVMCNEKAKLGGSGIALVAVMMHYMATKKEIYIDFAKALVRHILSRIDENGEMIGYYIHPDYHDAMPILNPTEDEKKVLFSFYYPGEALLGLALFHNEFEKTKSDFKHEIAKKAAIALDFLVHVRPRKYPEMFASLPSDSWLMQAIEAWAKNEEFQKKAYLDFVYNDAKSMIRQMYTPKNAPYFDYIGAYFYYYGEHAYPDAARSEGLVAAYNLAIAMNNTEMATYLLPNLKLAAKNMMYVFNNEASSYMHLYPKKTLGSFRLKFTRQWTRVDMTQHAVSFFIRLILSQHKDAICLV